MNIYFTPMEMNKYFGISSQSVSMQSPQLDPSNIFKTILFLVGAFSVVLLSGILDKSCPP